MHDAVATLFPRFLPGRVGTTTEGRAFIATLRGDARSAIRIREAGGEVLRERDDTLIWGFLTTTPPSDVEVLCKSLSHPEPENILVPAAEGWNFDISAAPKGGERVISGSIAGSRKYERRVHVKEKVFTAGTGGVVTVSYWIKDHERWNMFTKAVPPMAWRPYEEGAPLPRHPLAD